MTHNFTISDGDWSIYVSTLSNLQDADVALVAYGDKGDSGAIILAAPPGKPVFMAGNNDEFRVIFHVNPYIGSCLYKIMILHNFTGWLNRLWNGSCVC